MFLARLEGAALSKAYSLYVVEGGRLITQSKSIIWKDINKDWRLTCTRYPQDIHAKIKMPFIAGYEQWVDFVPFYSHWHLHLCWPPVTELTG